MKVTKVDQKLTRKASDYPNLDIRRVGLTNGQKIALREMIVSDQVFLENLPNNSTQTSQICQIISRLTVSIDEENIKLWSPKEVEALSIRNLKRLAEAYRDMNEEPDADS